jgi:hypothetical protein
MNTQTNHARDAFFHPLQEHANKELLKFAAGHNIFCPTCNRILDCKTTVHVSVMTGASCAHSLTSCETCWGKQEPRVAAVAAKHGATLDIVRWPGRKPKTPRTPKPAPVADPRQGQLNLQEETV